MEQVDLEGVEPTARVVDADNVLRGDDIVPSLDRDVALRGAPDASQESFRVPSPQA
jgi:aspartyl-tRNA(Asn)/glutamyl-tRNA(Gln) amidotransferase subunit C